MTETETGMPQMSEAYEETGRELYMGSGGREHDEAAALVDSIQAVVLKCPK